MWLLRFVGLLVCLILTGIIGGYTARHLPGAPSKDGPPESAHVDRSQTRCLDNDIIKNIYSMAAGIAGNDMQSAPLPAILTSADQTCVPIREGLQRICNALKGGLKGPQLCDQL